MSDETLGKQVPPRMRLRGDRARFGLLARAFHWTTPLLLLCCFGVIWSAAWLPPGPNTWAIVNLHRTIGILVLTFTVLRVLWRATDRQPERVGPWPLRWGARLVHGALVGLHLLAALVAPVRAARRHMAAHVARLSLPEQDTNERLGPGRARAI
jgi:cytochrome b561